MKILQRVLFIISVISIQLLANLTAHAGVYTDDLTRCIIETSTAEDRIGFVKWMFSATSRHPAVQSLSSVSEEQINEANEDVAELFMKLLTETCKEKAAKALKYEGQLAIQTSFNVLGQVAAQELFSDPNVASAISGLEKHIDVDKLKSSLGIK